MKEMENGQVLLVLADDPEILEDMPAWCKTTGNRFLKLEKEGSVFRLFVQKNTSKEQ
jgi:TusA-related sulfurtransferase